MSYYIRDMQCEVIHQFCTCALYMWVLGNEGGILAKPPSYVKIEGNIVFMHARRVR